MSTTARRIEIYDTTLRDGTQGEGFNLSLQDKVLIAQKLDELGVDYIEGGFPGSNEKDRAFFQEVKNLKRKHAKVSAFGMTRRRGCRPEDDLGMRALLDSQAPVITIVGKTSDFHVAEVLRVSLDENLAMIADTVRYLREAGRQRGRSPAYGEMQHFQDRGAPSPKLGCAARLRSRSRLSARRTGMGPSALDLGPWEGAQFQDRF